VGGGEIYRLALPHVTRLVVTEVDQESDGSVTFPVIDPQVWQETEREARPGLAFVTYRRRDQAS
jgi:dihydrofolate reductase